MLYCAAQSLQPFEISGTINNVNAKFIHLSPIVPDKKYYFTQVNDSCKLLKNKFSFKGKITYTHPFQLYYEDSISHEWVKTELFFVEKGKQLIHIDSFTEGAKVIVDNSFTNQEFLLKYLVQLKPFRSAWAKSFDTIDSISDYYNGKIPDSIMLFLRNDEQTKKNKTDTFLLDYVKSNQNSYVAFWKLIQKFSNLGYTSIYSQIYDNFSTHLKNTNTGKVLLKALKDAIPTSIGRMFPSISLVDIDNHKMQLPTTKKESKFIFLDFWYSHCAPCIAQFPGLRNIYSKYKALGFAIISVSTDKLSDRQQWKNAIIKYQLRWDNFWDINGLGATKLSINSFPTNFLLDQSGKIVKKNIDLTQLEIFLQEHLK